MTDPTSPFAFWTLAWSHLVQGATNRRSEFHSITLATLSERGPEARIMTLREADPIEALVRFHTDLRAPKVQELTNNPACGILLYGPKARIQIRGCGVAEFRQDDDLSLGAWSETQLLSRRTYLAIDPPGTPSPHPTSGLPPELENREPEIEESEPGLDNFGVVVVRLTRLDVMSLGFEGHRRAVFDLVGSEWSGCWVTP